MALATGPNAVGAYTVLMRVNRLSDKHDEALAAGTITPGDVIREKSNGDVIRHDQAGKFTSVIIAVEDTFQGRTIDTDYVTGEVVSFHRAQVGDTWLANLAATNYIVGLDVYLASNGDGKLKVAGAGDVAIAKAEQQLNASATLVQRLEARVVGGSGPAGALGTTTTTSPP